MTFRAISFAAVMGLLCLGTRMNAAAPETFDALAAQASSAREANRVAESIDLYRRALALNPKWNEGWWYLGTLLYDSDQYPGGQEAFSRLVALDPTAGPGWSFLGLCEFETGHYNDALEHIGRGLSLDKQIPANTENVLRFHEALLLTRLGQFDRALPLYSRFVRGGVKDPTLILGLGLTALGRPQLPAEVPADQRDVVSAAGQTAWLWEAGKTDEAGQAFGRLASSFPDARGVHYFYATWLLSSHPDQAGAELQRELQTDPHNARARAMIALMLLRSGEEKDAMPWARQAAADGPSTGMAQYVYGLLLAHAGDASGIAHLETAEKLEPENFEYHMALASAYSKFGRYEDALRERRASIAMAKAADEQK